MGKNFRSQSLQRFSVLYSLIHSSSVRPPINLVSMHTNVGKFSHLIFVARELAKSGTGNQIPSISTFKILYMFLFFLAIDTNFLFSQLFGNLRLRDSDPSSPCSYSEPFRWGNLTRLTNDCNIP